MNVKIISTPKLPTMQLTQLMGVINNVQSGDMTVYSAGECLEAINQVVNLKKVLKYQLNVTKEDSLQTNSKEKEAAYAAGAKIASLILCSVEGTIAFKSTDEIVRKIGVPNTKLNLLPFDLIYQLGSRLDNRSELRGDDNPVEITKQFKILRNKGLIPEGFIPNRDWEAFKLGFEVICWTVA